MSRFRRNVSLVFAFTVLLAGFMFAFAPSSIASKGGNSEAAKACQDGGYLNYTTADGEPFQNPGQCVQYAAQGGTLTEVESDHPTVDIEFFSSGEGEPFTGLLGASGLMPLTAVNVTVTTIQGDVEVWQFGAWEPDGTFSVEFDETECGYRASIFVEVTAADGSEYSEGFQAPC